MNLKKKALIITTFITVASISLLSFSNFETTRSEKTTLQAKAPGIVTTTMAKNIVNLYEELNLKSAGLSRQAYEYAANGYAKLKETHRLGNDRYLTIVDFSQSSRSKRFYLIDVINKKLVTNTFVAHGKNTGVDKATSFSNTPESNKSSIGLYLTKGTYVGKHGLSLRLSGLEKGFNDNAEARAIVVHGADYVSPARVTAAYMGRSLGCPALPTELSTDVINKIKDGSAMFLYYPEESYINRSEFINS